MDQMPDALESTPAHTKFPPVVRAIGIGALVLVLWSIDKVAVCRLPEESAWRYIIGGVLISIGLATVLSFVSRLNEKNS